MFSDFREPDKAQWMRLSDPEREGILQVEVPHWAAQVQIIKYDLNPLESVGLIKPCLPNEFISETVLPAGSYKVQTTLEGKAQSDWFTVRPGRITRILRENWSELKLSSAAPLEQTETSRESHAGPAEEWSRKITWKRSGKGNSRLFLFVRTLKPEKYRKFFEGLFLLNSEGKVVADFSEGIEHNPQDGWMAFNADLPEGGYILYRKRRNVKKRFQPIFLCRRWETQIFLVAEKFPLLKEMSVLMTHKGAGFSRHEDSAVAAEAVFKGFSYGTSHRQIAASGQMRSLLQNKFENAWFGILAAYALRLAQEEAISEISQTSADQYDLAEKLKAALRFLKSQIPAHPDVQALLLEDKKPAKHPFSFPPMIRLGLKRVQKHATKFVNTIEHGSLTYHVLENLFTDAPWTAWRKLERMPRFGRIEDVKRDASANLAKEQGVGMRRYESGKMGFSLIDAFLPIAQTSTPIYDLNSLETMPVKAEKTKTTVGDAALIQALDDLIKARGIEKLPERVRFDSAKAFSEILQVAPENISAASGLPLASVEHGLEKLRESEKSGFTKIPRSTATSKSAHTVFEYALRENEKKKRRPNAEKVNFSSEVTPFSPVLTIEELASKIRVEADRLEEEQSQPTVANAVSRLRKIAESFLAEAEYIVLTSPSGKILYFNSAFLRLLSGENTVTGGKSEDIRRSRRSAWESALRSAQLGVSNLPDPTQADKPSWAFKRIVVEDEASLQPKAYLNIFIKQDRRDFTADTLSQINEVSRRLSNQVLFFIYRESSESGENFSEIENLIAELENLVVDKK